MAVTVQGLGSILGHTNGVTREYAITSGSVVYKGEFVYLDANGRVTSDSIAGKALLGTVTAVDSTNLDRNYAASATGNAGGTIKALVHIDDSERYLCKNDQDTNTFAAEDVGEYFDLIGSPGSQLVDTSSASTTGQLLCVEYNPGIRGTDASYGIFKIAETQLDV